MGSSFSVLVNYVKVVSSLSVNKWQQKGETAVSAGYIIKLRIYFSCNNNIIYCYNCTGTSLLY